MQPSHDVAPQAGDGQTAVPREFAVRPTLPERDVSAETIEDAYVRFIFYCNPALPLDTDTENLREAFRTPPKSGGKTFQTYLVYELVKKFYGKQIKTWTELAIKLGVEPPDSAKDESVQKIAQYGVRLKKWMNSMHVKAFFEYLMNIQNDYWTKVPADTNPAAVPARDGVLVEDDMALRALLPHMRPKRGRKRPEAPDDATNSPAHQRQRLSPSSAVDDYRRQVAGSTTPWSAHPDARGSLSTDPGRGNGAPWVMNDAVPTPISRWPQSAVTPSTRGSFWDEALEPRSAVTPTKSSLSNLRRGAKNVSSAWKPGFANGNKSRGRPPINRTPVETPVEGPGASGLPLWGLKEGVDLADAVVMSANGHSETVSDSTQHKGPPRQHQSIGQATASPTHPANRPHTQRQHQQPPQEGSRPSRPSISLQVPQRPTGSVRLATPPSPPPPPPPPPPPAVTVNGHPENSQQAGRPIGESVSDWHNFTQEAAGVYDVSSNCAPIGFSETGPEVEEYYFEKMQDRTNVDVLMAYLVRSTADGVWVDEEGRPVEAASLEESTAIVNSTLQNMYKTATSPQGFLINLAALAGAMTLIVGRVRCFRLGEDKENYKYKCEWKYRFGHVNGHFTMGANVPRTMWKGKGAGAEAEGGAVGDSSDKEGSEGSRSLSGEDWKKKYESLLGEMEKREKEVHELRTKVVKSLREDRQEP